MKIMFVSESMAGGVLSVIQEVVGSLIPDNPSLDVIIVSIRREDTPKNIRACFPSQVRVMELKPLTKNPFKLLGVIFNLVNIITKEKPNIVHFHSSKAGFLGRMSIAFIRGRKRIKFFYSPHGFSFLMQNVSKTKRRMFWIVEYLMSKVGGEIIAIGEEEGAEARKLSKKVQVIPNFVDVDKFTPKVHCMMHQRRITIGTMGRIVQQKNPWLFERLAEKCPQCDFMWIGGGALEETLRSNNVKLTGFVQRVEAIEMLKQIDIYVQVSLWEGLPMAVLEAMACGLPVILSDIPGHREIAKYLPYECLAKSTDDFVEKINFLVSNPTLIIEYGQSCRQLVCEQYSRQKSVLAYKNLYGIV